LPVLRRTKIQRGSRRGKVLGNISRVARRPNWSRLTVAKHRICLITPGHLATNPRIVKEADALSEAGFDVSVITGDYLDWGRMADREFVDRPWHSDRKVGFGPLTPKATYVVQTARRRFARILVKRGLHAPAVIESAQHPISRDLIRVAKSVSADLYIAHYVAALPAAARAAARHGAKFAFDAEDFHLGDFPDNAEFDFERMLVRAIEQRYLRGCAYLTAASPGIAKAYSSTYGLPMPTVVLNVFPKSQAPKTPTPAGTAAPGPSLYWFSQTIGPDRGLETGLEALSLSVARPHLYIRGHLAHEFSLEIKRLALKLGVSEQVHFLDLAPPSEMAMLASAYDMGFVSETGSTRNRKIALTNKLFSFLLAGVPVAASAIPAHQQLFDGEDPIFLYEPADAKELAMTIDQHLLDRPRLRKLRQLAWQLGQDRYNWDREKDNLLAIVRTTLDAKRIATTSQIFG
jgi:glycosyltransferase involved in cell wall biosynthesis